MALIDALEEVGRNRLSIEGRIIPAFNIDLGRQGGDGYSITEGHFEVIFNECEGWHCGIFPEDWKTEKIFVVLFDKSNGWLLDSWEEFFRDYDRTLGK